MGKNIEVDRKMDDWIIFQYNGTTIMEISADTAFRLLSRNTNYLAGKAPSDNETVHIHHGY